MGVRVVSRVLQITKIIMFVIFTPQIITDCLLLTLPATHLLHQNLTAFHKTPMHVLQTWKDMAVLGINFIIEV